MGRFISRDPIKGVLTNPQTQNPYVYVGNNPVNLSDPSGEQAVQTLQKAGELCIQAYNKLSPALYKTGLQAHHIIEKRFAPILQTKANEMPSVALDPGTHQEITNAWRSAVGYANSATNSITTLTATADDIWKAAQDIYRSDPALLEAAKKIIFGQ